MKKLITAATAFTVAFALLTGCGGSSATTAQNTESDEAKQETVQETVRETVQEPSAQRFVCPKCKKIARCMDNLYKGAAGQAVQNMNLMFGLPEDTGLRLKPSAF